MGWILEADDKKGSLRASYQQNICMFFFKLLFLCLIYLSPSLLKQLMVGSLAFVSSSNVMY